MCKKLLWGSQEPHHCEYFLSFNVSIKLTQIKVGLQYKFWKCYLTLALMEPVRTEQMTRNTDIAKHWASDPVNWNKRTVSNEIWRKIRCHCQLNIQSLLQIYWNLRNWILWVNFLFLTEVFCSRATRESNVPPLTKVTWRALRSWHANISFTAPEIPNGSPSIWTFLYVVNCFTLGILCVGVIYTKIL